MAYKRVINGGYMFDPFKPTSFVCRAMLLFLSSAILYMASVRCSEPEPSPNDSSIVTRLPSDRKIVNFTAGAGNWMYQMGIACFISKHYTLRNVNFVGTSSGFMPAMALAYDVDIERLVSDSLLEHLQILHQMQSFGLLNFFCEYCMEHTIAYYRTLYGLDRRSSSRLFIAGAQLTRGALKKMYFTDGSSDSMVRCGFAGCWIPFLTVPLLKPLIRINNDYYIDGYLSGSRDLVEDPENMLIISPNVFKHRPAYKRWIWLDVDYNIAEFYEGFADAKKNKSMLDAFFRNLTIPHAPITDC
jgi:hypothetical protein